MRKSWSAEGITEISKISPEPIGSIPETLNPELEKAWIGADKSAKGPRNFQGREDVSRIKPSTKGSEKEEAFEGRGVLITDEGTEAATETGKEVTAELEKLGGAKEANGAKVGLKALSKKGLDGSTRSRAPEVAAGKSETVESRRSSGWMVPSPNEESAILKKRWSEGADLFHAR